jgi:hypothetical protein
VLAIVCPAFALELYLKILITMRFTTPPKTHSLVKLFGRLNKPTQDRIRNRFATIPRNPRIVATLDAKGAPSDFDGMLQVSDDAFERTRNVYKNSTQPAGKGWMATEITKAVRLVILDAKPSWGLRKPVPATMADAGGWVRNRTRRRSCTARPAIWRFFVPSPSGTNTFPGIRLPTQNFGPL